MLSKCGEGWDKRVSTPPVLRHIGWETVKATLASVLAAAVLTLAACGDDDSGESDREPGDRPASPAVDKPVPDQEPVASDGPLAQAEEYAKKLFPEATSTDDFLAAAVSGCYLGITGEYLGGPANMTPDEVAEIEYPEPDLRVILDQARTDC